MTAGWQWNMSFIENPVLTNCMIGIFQHTGPWRWSPHMLYFSHIKHVIQYTLIFTVKLTGCCYHLYMIFNIVIFDNCLKRGFHSPLLSARLQKGTRWRQKVTKSTRSWSEKCSELKGLGLHISRASSEWKPRFNWSSYFFHTCRPGCIRNCLATGFFRPNWSSYILQTNSIITVKGQQHKEAYKHHVYALEENRKENRPATST